MQVRGPIMQREFFAEIMAGWTGMCHGGCFYRLRHVRGFVAAARSCQEVGSVINT